MKLPWYIKEIKGVSPYNSEMPTVYLKFHWVWVLWQRVIIFLTKIWKGEIAWRKVFGIKPKLLGAKVFVKIGEEWKPIGECGPIKLDKPFLPPNSDINYKAIKKYFKVIKKDIKELIIKDRQQYSNNV